MGTPLSEKVVLVTGAGTGLGEATARLLAEKGASVVLTGREMAPLEKIAGEIGKRARAFVADVTKREQIDLAVKNAIDAFGRLDVMINNAGVMAIAPLAQGRVEEWDKMIDVNVKGVLYGIAAALPLFERQGRGHFVNMASVAGLKLFSPGGAVYSATKFAVRAISEGLRQEVGGKIRVTTISPGAIDSQLKFGSSDKASREGVIAFYEQAIPSSSVARAIAWAIEQPEDVDINEIVLRPTVQDF
jgi:NADP-dependent 3-hydroxy acid dehydrogenase YdfG